MKDVGNHEALESYRQTVLHLVNEAETILQKIKVGDIFGIGSQQEYLDDKILSTAMQWTQKVHDVGAMSLTPLAQELRSLWIIDGNRVSSARIKRAVEILKQI